MTKVMYFLSVVFFSINVFAGEIAFLDLARDSEGKVKYMSQSEAIMYCLSKDAHLASIRELAQFLINHGAKGFLPMDSCDSDKIVSTKCTGVIREAKNTDGSINQFGFSSFGYQAPADVRGKVEYWASSVMLRAPEMGFALIGKNGKMGICRGNGEYCKAAALCVADSQTPDAPVY